MSSLREQQRSAWPAGALTWAAVWALGLANAGCASGTVATATDSVDGSAADIATDAAPGETADAAGSDSAPGTDTASSTDSTSGTDTASGTDAASGTDSVSGTDAASSTDSVSGTDTAGSTDSATGTDAAAGALACYAIVSCVDGCAAKPDAATCAKACTDQGTASAQKAYQAVLPCLATDSPACEQAYIDCVDPSGTKTCNAVVSAIGSICKFDSPPGCAMTLAHDVHPVYAKNLAAMAQCVFPCVTACAGNKSCQSACYAVKCASKIDICVKQPIRLPP